ncbi:hypothetical protein Bcep18194_B2185 [Burkholderia lata]|uniref:Uncharacterized protein n=1 Tax=Burkholderia lata (strain ATCC 17760 / DSM 23089 / LMG 22485 / NCIMB 9086 / R18194 / 383) TaxID=482957 RepID=Q393S0_BURL3|nr:hypothetical protein Bcep18194_B2185 [Burkholderia lata]
MGAIDANRAPASSANVSKLKRLPDRRTSAARAVTPHRPSPRGQRGVASARDRRTAYNRPTVPHECGARPRAGIPRAARST